MCKQIIVTKPWQTLSTKAVNSLKAIVCAGGNADGFGLATTDATGIRYLKYVKPSHRIGKTPKPIHKQAFVYGGEGLLPAKAHNALLAHGRYSTNDIGLAETHPILNADHSIALVHNGVVKTSKQYPVLTRNDSELILRAYEAGGIKETLELGGYFAFGLIDYRHDRLFVVRDNQAMLYVSQVDTTGSYVFATRAEDIRLFFKTPAGQLNGKTLKHSEPVQMKDNTVVSFQLSTGELLDTYGFSKAVTPYSNVSTDADYDMDNVLNYTARKGTYNSYWGKGTK